MCGLIRAQDADVRFGYCAFPDSGDQDAQSADKCRQVTRQYVLVSRDLQVEYVQCSLLLVGECEQDWIELLLRLPETRR